MTTLIESNTPISRTFQELDTDIAVLATEDSISSGISSLKITHSPSTTQAKLLTSFSKNLTSQALGHLYRGNLTKATTKVVALAKPLSHDSNELDAALTLRKMCKTIEKCPYIDSAIVLGNIDISTHQISKNKPVKNYQTQTLMSGVFSQDAFKNDELKRKTPTSDLLDLTTMEDSKIFDIGIPIVASDADNKIISFSNVQFGGGCPDISLKTDMPFSLMYKKNERIGFLQEILDKHNIVITKKLSELNASSLIQEIAQQINDRNLSIEEKSTLLEKAILDIVVVLVGRSSLASEYLYEFKNEIPLGREYFGYTDRGFSLATLYAYYNPLTQKSGIIPLNMFIKQGGADCRGFNTLYALLLNTGYETLKSPKEAKILYVKSILGRTNWTGSNPTDHNIVIVRDSLEKDQKKYKVMDARWHNLNNISLRQTLLGTVDAQGVAIQIVGANHYPKEQEFEIKKSN